MLPDSTCATLRSTHDGRFGRGVSASPETLSRPEAGISDACPRPCDAMPDAPETPEVPEMLGTHPSAAAASCHSSDTLCLLFSLIADGGIRRQKYTIFRYESPPAAHFRSCFSPRVPACPDFAVFQALPVSLPRPAALFYPYILPLSSCFPYLLVTTSF